MDAFTGTRARWALLGAGTLVSLVAAHGRWEVAGAAWIHLILLLRFSRTSRVLPGLAGIVAATVVATTFWLYESGLPVFSPVLLLSLAMALATAVPYVLDRLVAARLGGAWGTLVFPAAVVGVEYALATATPVGNILSSLAATQHDNLPLIQLASLTGSYGVSFLIAWFAAVCNHVWEDGFAWRRVVPFGAVLGLVLAGGSLRLASSEPAGETVRVAGVSPARAVLEASDRELNGYDSPEQLSQADPATIRRAFAPVNDSLLAATEREAMAGARIVVWPEAGGSTREADRQQLIGRIAEVATRTGAYVEAGMIVLTGAPPYMRNEAVLVDPRGKVVWTHQKARPVPGLDPFDAGDGRVPTADTPFGRLAGVICFDADFPVLMRQARDVDLMLVPSNDWYGFGATHTEKAVMRAVENGYSLVRQDSNGLAAVVDPRGRVLASADYFAMRQQTVTAYVPVSGTPTPYALVGDVFAWLCAAGLGVLAGVAVRRRPARTRPRVAVRRLASGGATSR
ncbi:apolipoprotein N-acyltransferase [Nonomuraea sp. SYSU D8015]|uniref:apolipoprotein N-acyltransferase n=1 Tax=Nonomuraea sp. SYSU D8015 TaxID=2593644 RepID=UPI0016612DD4|nr:nitrilase-related carbon-nitrogen hydrolase [Nonomuraea sp. SYSU D8015]